MSKPLPVCQLASVVAGLRAGPEKRAVYRMQPGGSDEIVCRLHLGTAAAVVGLLDISARGAHLHVPAAACTALRAGTKQRRPLLHLSLEAPSLRSPLRLTARVRHRSPLGDGHHIHVEFSEAVRCGADVDRRLLALFNRRMALRVDAPIAPSVSVRLALPGVRARLSGILVDASLSGVGLAISPPPGLSPRSPSPVALALRLDGEQGPTHLHGTVVRWSRRSTAAGAADFLGVSFGEEQRGASQTSRQLARHVVAWQLEARLAAG